MGEKKSSFSVSQGISTTSFTSTLGLVLMLFFGVAFMASFFSEMGQDDPTFWLMPLLGVLLGSLFFFIWEGYDFDLEKRKVRYYKSFWRLFKIGAWYDMDEYQYILLERQQHKNSHDQWVSTYDLVLVSTLVGQSVLLEEFVNYSKARDQMAHYSKLLGYPARNSYQEELLESREKKAKRGRRR